MIEKNFVKLYEEAFQKNWSLPALTNYEEGKSYTSADVAKHVAKVHLLLAASGLQKGDKVALIAKDSAEWCMVWLGIVTSGCVVVPILPDFHAEDIRNIIRHSDSKAVFAGKEHQKVLQLENMPDVEVTFDLERIAPIAELTRNEALRGLDARRLFNDRYIDGFTKDEIRYPEISNEELMVISYTSGTTGFSKGVMITANNLAANMKVTLAENTFERGRNVLCFLPNAHAYSCAFNFLLPLIVGSHIYILGSKPTPTILLKAFKDVRPHIIITVPMVLEKIYKNVIVPKISGFGAKLALGTPLVRSALLRKIRNGLLEAMGGEVIEVIVGGAALNEEVGTFLHKAKFPYTVGYGMTECAPLISYVRNSLFVPGSCGQVLNMIEEVRIADAKEVDGKMIGEVQVRGENVCKGYYKEAQLSADLFTADGWMHTGDLGFMDKANNLYLRGRSKTMILGSNGQNIYPEEIEAKIAMLPYMADAIVVHREGAKLVALVTMDEVALKRDGKDTPAAIQEILKENRQVLNERVAAFAAVAEFELIKGDFERTPKQSIKRYLYK